METVQQVIKNWQDRLTGEEKLIIFAATLSLSCSALIIFLSYKTSKDSFLARLFCHQGISNFLFGISSFLYQGVYSYHTHPENFFIGNLLIVFSANLSAISAAHIALYCYWMTVINTRHFERYYGSILFISYFTSFLMASLYIMDYHAGANNLLAYICALFMLTISLVTSIFCYLRVFCYVSNNELPIPKKKLLVIPIILMTLWAPSILFDLIGSAEIRSKYYENTIINAIHLVYIFILKSVGLINFLLYGPKIISLYKESKTSSLIIPLRTKSEELHDEHTNRIIDYGFLYRPIEIS